MRLCWRLYPAVAGGENLSRPFLPVAVTFYIPDMNLLRESLCRVVNVDH